jgi:hypothetical protein
VERDNSALLSRLKRIRGGVHYDRFHAPAVHPASAVLPKKDIERVVRIQQRYGSLRLQQERRQAFSKLESENSVRA